MLLLTISCFNIILKKVKVLFDIKLGLTLLFHNLL